MNTPADTFFAQILTAHPPAEPDNPLLQPHEFFPYNKLKAEHLVPAAQWLLAYVNSACSELEMRTAAPTWATIMAPLEDIEAVMGRVSVPAINVYTLHKTDKYREPFATFQQLIVQANMRLAQSKPLYTHIKALTKSAEFKEFSSARQRAITQCLRAQELAGIHLQGQAQQTFVATVEKLTALALQFSNHIADSMKAYTHVLTDPAEVEGLPYKTLASLSAQYSTTTEQPSTPEAGPWLIKLDQNSVADILKYGANAALRQKIYQDTHHKTYQGSYDNTKILHQILELRQQKAMLLDFPCYADMVLSTRMADSPATVMSMHEEFLQATAPGLQQEHDALTELKRQLEQAPKAALEPWDVAYYRDQYIRKEFQFNPAEVASYLPLESVLSGMFKFFKDIFGVSFHLIQSGPEAPQMWHEDVRIYKVYDHHTQTELATLFLDLFARPGNKNPGAWMRGERARRRNSHGEIEAPIAHIACNFAPPTANKPSLLEFNDLTTLFHEFGHALQHMLTTVDVAAVSGTHVGEWDIVELPSQFMENWCYQKDILMSFARHYQTDQPLPEELFARMISAKNFGSAYHYARQVALGMVDMKLHSTSVTNAYDVYQELLTDIFPFHEPNGYGDKMLAFFSHIFAGGYSAGYYSYLWARIYAADAFALFEEAGLQDGAMRQELGAKFKNTILALGGSAPPREIYYKFSGSHHISPAALLRHEGLLPH